VSATRSLLTIDDLGADGIVRILDLADHMAEVNRRPNPKVPALRGKTVCSVFFEDSTRTRLSFETAAKRLSADTMTFAISQSSLNKGESLRDTVETIAAMGVDAFVVRHASSGAAHLIDGWTQASVINAGDGWHAHPTQALLDVYTVRTALGRGVSTEVRPRLAHAGGGLDGLRMAIVGDVKHSRVARSTIAAMRTLGVHVTVVAPRTLLPPDAGESLADAVTDDFDSILADIDVLYLLRMQRERMHEALVPSLREYTTRFGLTSRRAGALGSQTLIMHPGPMNRGVEIAVDPAELPGAVITQQVTNGIAVRMAVLFDLLGSGALAEAGTLEGRAQ
jgi:aspartate carbamoyltransferase catalytic subunit